MLHQENKSVPLLTTMNPSLVFCPLVCKKNALFNTAI